MDVKKKNIDISFYRHLWRIVFPIIIQNLLSAAVSSADVIMLNYVGQSALSASALAVQYVNVISMVIYGMGTGAVILMIVASETRPILLTTAMYTSDIHQNIRPNDTTLK